MLSNPVICHLKVDAFASYANFKFATLSISQHMFIVGVNVFLSLCLSLINQNDITWAFGVVLEYESK